MWLSLLTAFIACSIGTYFLIGVLTPGPARVNSRLASLRHQPAITHARTTPRQLELERPPIERLFAPLLKASARWGGLLTPEGQRERLVAKLQQAGFYRPIALHSVMTFKGLGVIATLIAAWLVWLSLPPVGVLIGGAGLAVSLIAPEMFINKLVAQRQLELVRALPDTLDLITASVEAGLTLDGAISRIVERPSKAQLALADELARYLQEIRLGRSRAEALSELGRRCGIADLQSVVAALLQADSLGVGVATVLRAQSQYLRIRRKQRAQEAAMKAPVKMLFPLVLFIFPSIFIVTLGPAVIKIMDTFAPK